jgi:glycosyltransferase involved in cell wall biosynthesis
MISLTITLVTPTLNRASFLPPTIDSVLRQAYPGLEYWVVDGGSTDSTLDLLRSYGDRLRWISEADSGQSEAINKGWRLGQGEILGWLNSDDLLYPAALERVAAFFAQHPEIDFVYGDCDLIDKSGNLIQAYPVKPYDYQRLLYANYIPQPAAFMRRRLLEQEGWLDETLDFVMDYDYWLRGGINHKGAYLPFRLAALRLHSSAKSVAQLGKFAAEQVYTFRKLFSRPDLPSDVRAMEKEVMGNVYFLAADSSFWSNRLAAGRAYARKSFSCHKRLRSLWLWLALGQPGRWLAGQLYRNPYFPGRPF